VDDDAWPAQVLFRDLEGTKLVSSRHAALLSGLPAGVARGLAYDARRGWDRVAYCLLVNHLARWRRPSPTGARPRPRARRNCGARRGTC
jgi:siderophore synthetase component